MKKILSLVLAVLMLATLLCACEPAANPNTTTKPQGEQPAGSTPAATQKPTEAPTNPAGDSNVINADDFLGDAANW